MGRKSRGCDDLGLEKLYYRLCTRCIFAVKHYVHGQLLCARAFPQYSFAARPEERLQGSIPIVRSPQISAATELELRSTRLAEVVACAVGNLPQIACQKLPSRIDAVGKCDSQVHRKRCILHLHIPRTVQDQDEATAAAPASALEMKFPLPPIEAISANLRGKKSAQRLGDDGGRRLARQLATPWAPRPHADGRMAAVHVDEGAPRAPRTAGRFRA